MNIFLQLISCILLAGFSWNAVAEPINLSLVKTEVQQYHDTGLYEKELSAVIKQAHDYILSEAEKNKNENQNKKLAIVLDIDETSLSNYDKMIKRDFVGNREAIHQEILAANSPAIVPMLAFYKDIITHNIKVFFVTGRDESERLATEANLLQVGYRNWTELIVKPLSYHETSIIPFKTQARQNIAQKGYVILATIGDQKSDIEGGYALKGFKLPNPYYFLP